jgi:co-chaperonin GroES (HSP10)
MTLDNFHCIFRQLLILEVKEEKSKGGIYIPSSDFLPVEERWYKVIKIADDCLKVKEGDLIRLQGGFRQELIKLDQYYLQVMEQQVISLYRE